MLSYSNPSPRPYMYGYLCLLFLPPLPYFVEFCSPSVSTLNAPCFCFRFCLFLSPNFASSLLSTSIPQMLCSLFQCLSNCQLLFSNTFSPSQTEHCLLFLFPFLLQLFQLFFLFLFLFLILFLYSSSFLFLFEFQFLFLILFLFFFSFSFPFLFLFFSLFLFLTTKS
jgi:hypothetical protein